MTLSFAERIRTLHEALSDAGIGHGFGGAVALAYYVRQPRATRDIDVNVSVPTEDARRVLAALPSGLESGEDAENEIVRRGQIRLWWDGRHGVPVDLFFPQHEFHAEVARDTREVPFLDGAIPIISATHLVVFKSLFNRSRDWADIEAVLEAGTADSTAALSWLERLVGTDSDAYGRLSQLVGRTSG